MFLEILLFSAMAVAVVVKWYTAVALRDRRVKLNGAYEEQAQAKSRLKALAGSAAISDREVEKLNRHIKSTQRKIEKLQSEYDGLMQNAAVRAEMDQEKLRLAQELDKNR